MGQFQWQYSAHSSNTAGLTSRCVFFSEPYFQFYLYIIHVYLGICALVRVCCLSTLPETLKVIFSLYPVNCSLLQSMGILTILEYPVQSKNPESGSCHLGRCI